MKILGLPLSNSSSTCSRPLVSCNEFAGLEWCFVEMCEWAGALWRRDSTYGATARRGSAGEWCLPMGNATARVSFWCVRAGRWAFRRQTRRRWWTDGDRRREVPWACLFPMCRSPAISPAISYNIVPFFLRKNIVPFPDVSIACRFYRGHRGWALTGTGGYMVMLNFPLNSKVGCDRICAAPTHWPHLRTHGS
jgi:hypothetical protein